MRRFTKIGTNTGFVCSSCGAEVPPLENGSVRNHCPWCLSSVHVDEFPGDRASDCGGVLSAVGVVHSGKKGWIVIHKCQKCSAIRRNKAALDDPVAPDDFELIVQLSKKPTPLN